MTGRVPGTDGASNPAALPAPKAVLMHLLRTTAAGDRQVLLGVKKRGFGQGKLIAPGGRIEPGESPLDAAVRETQEECGLHVPPSAASQCALLDFRFPHRAEWSTVVAVFQTREFSGQITPSDELDGEWHDVAGLDLGRMWDDDSYWLHPTLRGRKLSATFWYGPDNETVERAELRTVS